MKYRVYNDILKATKMIQKKGYDFEQANQMAIRLFDKHTMGMVTEMYVGIRGVKSG